MALTRTGFNIIFTSGVEDPVSAALDLGTNPGKLVAGFISVNNAYQVFSAGVDGGDAIPLIDMEVIDGFKRYGFAGVVTQTGLQSIIFDTDAPVGQGKWGQVASYDGASGVRAGGAVYGFASGVNPSVNLTGMTAGDMMLMLGISNGAAQPLSPAGGATDFDGGSADSVALQKVAGGASDTIAGTWAAPSAAYVLALAIAPIPDPAGITGNITTDDATPTGTITSLAPASLTGNITTDAAAPTGTLGAAPGTITTQPWKNDAGDPQPLLTVPLMTFLRRSDGVQVLTLANQITSSSPTAPVIAVTNAALVPGVFYMVASWNADGSLYGIEPYQAA